MNLFDLLKNNRITPLFLTKKGHFVVDDIYGIALLVATAYKAKKGSYLLVASNFYKAQQIFSALQLFLAKDDLYLFPNDELIRAETIAQSKEMAAARLYTLNAIINREDIIVVANLASATRYLPAPSLFKSRTFSLIKGQNYKLKDIRTKLITSGYTFVNKVDQSLQFAIRGDILDIFSVNHDFPVRVEFFDEEIESIRFFDLAKQTSIEEIKEVTILPASDILLSEKDKKESTEKLHAALENSQEVLSLTAFEKLRDNVDEVAFLINDGQIDEQLYKYYGFLSSNHYSIFDYCQNFTKVFVDTNSLKNSHELLQNDAHAYLMELYENAKALPRLEIYQDIFRLVKFQAHITTSAFVDNPEALSFGVRNVPFQASKTNDAFQIITSYLDDEFKVVLSLTNKDHLVTIKQLLKKEKVTYQAVTDFDLPNKALVGITSVPLESGFVLNEEKIVYLTSAELFNQKVRLARFDHRFKEATILKSYEELEPGDYIVHEYQGIGQFIALQTLEVDGLHKDYLKIAYWGNEFLYIPLAQFQLVRKYLGKEGTAPRLSRLHSKDWENTKKKAKARVNELAERLMHLYIERSKTKGFAFQKDDEFQRQFEEGFAYPLTSDQQRALDEIKSDMESPTPMDRLLCGDVGFGKTEVAFRAAFKAILSGKQVAILCPTTLLARQHYELARERFDGFDVKAVIFSRLIPLSRQRQYFKKVASGQAHLIIGTHRLLSKEMSFNDLGLLIIDEEQRFGVEQKEKIKELKKDIDVLTLTATPIPRTLQISLIGVRSMSKIDTPPRDRMPIQTYVTPFKLDIAKELIEREIGRQGQVFFMHNNIATLYNRVSQLQKMIPHITIGAAHGQMKREDIEDVMMRFYEGEIDVLVATSIIENGIDVPNANMIIVEDSEKYGLSQLYQIKGRVGRSSRLAYAYLMYSPYKILNEKAKKRLKALQDFTQLGSGYKIAQRDLMIRGAGDILGPEQAGYIDSIGLDMYVKLLNEAIKEKMNGTAIEPEAIEFNPTFNIDAYIPNSYAKGSDKIELYQEILNAPSPFDLAYIKQKTRDIYGRLPEEVEMLFTKRDIDLLTKEAKVLKLEEKPRFVEMTLGEEYLHIRGIGNILFEALIPFLALVKISYANNVFRIKLTKRSKWMSDLESILKSLLEIKKHFVVKEGA
ncbi:MAG: transcription-repair coupling factor [Erysipelotrichia bacterium]|nr:transcription-repair coupling factor [Erysipelotrichia bacterium]